MREKELRLALVCFGGVSLAIYIHGVSKEILKLARASKAFNAILEAEKEHLHEIPELFEKIKTRINEL
ncbi:hypothetical protein N9R64_02190 [Emcibacteraceae bacterium]|nr:hypothetical protein [Emcibacteraceae bacterium]